MLVYVDESGHPRPTDDTSRPVLLSVIIKETDMKELCHRMYNIKNDIYGRTDVEVKATNLITERTLRLNHTNNKKFVGKLMELITDFDIKICAVIMEKPDIIIQDRDGILPPQYRHLLKYIELYCKNHDCSMALAVFDEQDRYEDAKISIAFNNFLYKSALGKSFVKILQVPLFANSEVTPGVQLADLMAGIVRHYYEKGLDKRSPETDFEKWLCDLFSVIKNQTEDLKEKETGYNHYSLFEMSKTTLEKEYADTKSIVNA